MPRVKQLLLLLMVALCMVSIAHAEEVIIDDAYTTSAMGFHAGGEEVVNSFSVNDPVMYVVDYTIDGKPNKVYKTIIVVRSLGDRLSTVEKHKPGTYRTVFTNLAGKDYVGENDVSYEVKIKRRGTLVDVGSATSTIFVSDDTQSTP